MISYSVLIKLHDDTWQELLARKRKISHQLVINHLLPSSSQTLILLLIQYGSDWYRTGGSRPTRVALCVFPLFAIGQLNQLSSLKYQHNCSNGVYDIIGNQQQLSLLYVSYMDDDAKVTSCNPVTILVLFVASECRSIYSMATA